MTINDMVDGILEREGRYVDHPSDPGGRTNWGITERVARENGYSGDMRLLPKATAAAIYTREYIEKPKFSGIADRDPLVAEEVIDSGVNAGQSRAAKWFQESLNVLNRRQRDYRDLLVDGDIGPASLGAFEALRRKRGPAKARQLLLKCLNGLQFAHYYRLAEGGTKFEDFMVGWLDTRIGAL